MVARGLPYALSLFFTATAVLKLWRGGYACFDPWAPVNGAMIPVELLLGWCLCTESRRSFGTLLATATMTGAAALLTWAHLRGIDAAGCGCFGPIRLPYGAHLAVIAALMLLSLVTLLAPRPVPPPPLPRMRLKGSVQ